MRAAPLLLAAAPSADPVFAAIEAHRVALAEFRAEAAFFAKKRGGFSHPDFRAQRDAYEAATDALLSHLRWWLSEEAVNNEGYGEHWPMAQARAADLTLFLGTPPVPAVYPQAHKLGHAASRAHAKAGRRIASPAFEMFGPEDLPGAIDGWEAVAPIRPDTPFSRSLRLIDGMGETFAALSLICGGLIVVGLATLA